MFKDRWCLWEAPSYPKGVSSSSIVDLTSSLKIKLSIWCMYLRLQSTIFLSFKSLSHIYTYYFNRKSSWNAKNQKKLFHNHMCTHIWWQSWKLLDGRSKLHDISFIKIKCTCFHELSVKFQPGRNVKKMIEKWQVSFDRRYFSLCITNRKVSCYKREKEWMKQCLSYWFPLFFLLLCSAVYMIQS